MGRTEDGVYDRQAVVRAMYHGLFGREPDPAGFAHNLARMKENSLADMLREFVVSDEFRMRITNPQFEFNLGPRLQIETSLSEDDLDTLWSHVSEVWTRLGNEDPYHSVLTTEGYEIGRMQDPDAIDAFYDTSQSDMLYLDAFLARNGIEVPSNSVVAEFGCGLGRATMALAARFSKVLAFDISKPHIDAASHYLSGKGIRNVDYILASHREDLARLENYDFFFSFIVLQHNPPPIIMDILEKAFSGLNPGGVAFFQVPTYARGYSFSLQAYLRDIAAAKDMEMHFVPQSEVLRVGREKGVVPIEILPDSMVRNNDWISTTFLMKKPN